MAKKGITLKRTDKAELTSKTRKYIISDYARSLEIDYKLAGALQAIEEDKVFNERVMRALDDAGVSLPEGMSLASFLKQSTVINYAELAKVVYPESNDNVSRQMIHLKIKGQTTGGSIAHFNDEEKKEVKKVLDKLVEDISNINWDLKY